MLDDNGCYHKLPYPPSRQGPGLFRHHRSRGWRYEVRFKLFVHNGAAPVPRLTLVFAKTDPVVEGLTALRTNMQFLFSRHLFAPAQSHVRKAITDLFFQSTLLLEKLLGLLF